MRWLNPCAGRGERLQSKMIIYLYNNKVKSWLGSRNSGERRRRWEERTRAMEGFNSTIHRQKQNHRDADEAERTPGVIRITDRCDGSWKQQGEKKHKDGWSRTTETPQLIRGVSQPDVGWLKQPDDLEEMGGDIYSHPCRYGPTFWCVNGGDSPTNMRSFGHLLTDDIKLIRINPTRYDFHTSGNSYRFTRFDCCG